MAADGGDIAPASSSNDAEDPPDGDERTGAPRPPQPMQHPQLQQQQQARAPQPLSGGGWQSDKDAEDRKKMIAKIVQHLRQRKPNAPQEWLNKVPQMAKRLEESLYRSAPSLVAYNDISTLKQRLIQLAMDIGKRLQQQQQQAQQPGGQPLAQPQQPQCQQRTQQPPQQVAAPPQEGVPLQQPHLQQQPQQPNPGAPVAAPTELPADAAPAVGSDKQYLLRVKQQRLLLLRHAARCQHQDNQCPVTPHCAEMKRVWKHIAKCRDDQCPYPHCVGSRYVLTHYHLCKDEECQVCRPVREAISRSHEKQKKPQAPKHGISKIETVKYANREYEGELKDDKPHGKGTLKYANGDVYDGDWKDAVRHGKGVCTYGNGNVYKGEWKDNKMHGEGRFEWKDGEAYEGEWIEGKKRGTGVYRYADGGVYDGEWKDDEWHGRGEMSWTDGDVYDGEWVEGEYHGWGTLTYASGKVYKGEFDGGVRHGKGTMTYPSGSICEGRWAGGKHVYSDERQLRSPRSQEQRLQKNVATKHCEHCGADDYRYKLRVCSGCNLALYCSVACQEAAKGPHRRICSIVSELPERSSDRLVLKYDRETMADLDAALRYGTKYMDEMKHLQINLDKMDTDDAIKLSPKKLSSLLRSKEGKLDSVSWISDYGITRNGDAVWEQLHVRDLKQLQLHGFRFNNVQHVYDLIDRQKNTLLVLSLSGLDIDWKKESCRTTLALAVSFCSNLVKLDLAECVLFDSDLEIMLYSLPNLRSLNLERNVDFSGLTDNSCELIARKCPNLQHLNLEWHHDISVKGIRRIFECCVQLRAFHTTEDLSCKDIQGLLDTAPQLLLLALDSEIDASDEEIDEIIEATGGRTLIRFNCGGEVQDPTQLSDGKRDRYERQQAVYDEIASKKDDPGVVNEWEDLWLAPDDA